VEEGLGEDDIPSEDEKDSESKGSTANDVLLKCDMNG